MTKQQDYAALIEEALTVLSLAPDKGKRRQDIGADIWVYPIARPGRRARHVFLYRIAGHNVDVAAFLYDGMDMKLPRTKSGL